MADDDFDFLSAERELEEKQDLPRQQKPESDWERKKTEEFAAREKRRTRNKKEMNALGVIWLAMGLLSAFGIGALIAEGPIQVETKYAPIAAIYGVHEPRFTIPRPLLFIALGMSVGILLAGIGALAHSSTGVGIGLLLTYLSLIGNILTLNVCVAVLLIFIVVQGHRVLKTAADLKTAGA
jgi:hypothetical protein